MDFENLPLTLLLWIIGIGLLWLPDLFGMKAWALTTKIVGMVAALPIAYFIAQWQGNKG